MTSSSDPRPMPRFLAVHLPKLPTDRIRRERLGRSWRSAMRPPAAAAAPPAEALLPVPLGSGNGHRLPAGGAAARPSQRLPVPAGPAGLAPLALFARLGGTERIADPCEIAEGMGLSAGLGVAEARARFPGLELVPADPAADRRLLDRLAEGCDRYTPLVAGEGDRSLLLDITGCAHLFGGEAALRRDLAAHLHHAGFRVRTALASSPWTALAVARHGAAEHADVPAGGEAAAAAALPVAALEREPDRLAALRRLGLERLGDLANLPRAALVRRFGEALARRLDEVGGQAMRPIRPRRPVPVLAHERRLFEPVSLEEDVLRLADHLAARLRPDLEARGEGARELELALFRVDGHVERLTLRTGAPLRDPARIARLFRERLQALGERLDAGFGYDLLRLSVLRADALAAGQGDLEGRGAEPAEGLGALLDRFGARLGDACVLSLEPVATHRPEHAQRRAAPLAGPGEPSGVREEAPIAPRPLRLLGRPEPVEATAEVPDGPIRQFRWRRAHYRVGRLEGPERIGAEWWREDAVPERDYFRVEDEAGRRYWMFREGARPDGASGWFLHGLFA